MGTLRARVPLRRGARARGDARRRARRGHGRRAARRRRHRLRAGADRARARARALPAAAEPRRRSSTPAPTALAVAERLLDLIERAASTSAPARPPRRARATRRSGFEGVSFAYPGRAGAGARRRRPGAPRRARRSRWSARAAAARAPSRRCSSRLDEPTPGGSCVGGVDLAACDPAAWRRADRLGAAAPDAVPRDRRRQHPPRRPGRLGRARCARRPRSAGADAFVERAAARLRDGRRRRRPAAVGRRAPADRARARVPARRAARRSSTSRPRTSIRRAPSVVAEAIERLCGAAAPCC